MNIVLVDDDLDYLELSEIAAREYCGIHEVRAFSCPRKAVATAGHWKQQAHLIVLDYHLAQLTALDVLSDLRARGCAQPFAVVSSEATALDRQLCLKAGALAVLKKPPTLQRIARSLRTLVTLQHLRCAGRPPASSMH